MGDGVNRERGGLTGCSLIYVSNILCLFKEMRFFINSNSRKQLMGETIPITPLQRSVQNSKARGRKLKSKFSTLQSKHLLIKDQKLNNNHSHK